MNNDNVKIINLNNNNNNHNNNNNNKISNNFINEITFNNNDNKENLQDFFLNTNNIIIEENVALEDKEKQYKNDIIYIEELENQLLSSYPVTKQSLKYIQQNVKNEVLSLIELKNNSIKKFNMYKENIHYPLINNIINNQFDNSFIIPIVLDTHKIFTNIDSNENEIINNNINQKNIEKVSFGLSYEDPEGYKEENQKNLIKELNKNIIEFEENKKSFHDFLATQSNLYSSYNIKYTLKNNIDQNGFIVKTINNNVVLRYYDLFNSEWDSHNNNDDLMTPINIYDEDGKIKEVKQETLINGQNMNIVGFMILHNGGKNILDDYQDIYKKKNYSNHLQKVLYDNKKIQHIEPDKDEIVIKINDHDISDNDIIYIDNTNCFPSINNFYGNKIKFKLIDKDTIKIKTNFKLQLSGNKGDLYKISKLKYDLYNINNNLDFEFLRSNYNHNTENIKHNKIFLFNNINLDKQKYDTIIKNILPSLSKIIELESDNLKKSVSFEEVNHNLKNYNITINDLFIEQGKYIKHILKKNLKSVKIEFNKKIYDNIKNFHYKNIIFLKEKDYILNNKNIERPFIKKYYNIYPYLNESFDNTMQRYHWITNKNDYGDLYYLQTVLENDNMKKFLPYLKDKINNYKKELISVENMFLKNKSIENKTLQCKFYGYEAILITEENIQNKYKNLGLLQKNNYYVFLNNELYNLYFEKNKEKLEKIENIENNSKLLLNHEIWIYNKDKWEYNNVYSPYTKLKYVCEFNNINIENIELDSLDCIYKKDIGCESKTNIRFSTKINLLKKNIEDFEELEKNIKNNSKKKNIEEKLNTIIEKYYYEDLFNTKKKIDKNTGKKDGLQKIIESIPLRKTYTNPLDKLIASIYKLRNPQLIESLFYEMIDKDGLLINMDLYSKKYNCKYKFCGHYYYFKKISYSNNANEREKYIQLLLSKFSDDGEAEKNNLICKNCGEYLMNNDYDETEGFSSSGFILRSRDEWTNEDWKLLKDEYSIKDISTIISSTKILDCTDEEFKRLLLNGGLDNNNINEALEICTFITKNLYSKLGIILPNGDLITTIIESIQKISNIYPYSFWKSLEIKKLEKTISRSRIEQMDEKGIFKTKYIQFREIMKHCIILSRLLITIQTIIPILTLQKRTSYCQFINFEGNNGIEFMSCILQELNNDTPKEKEKLLEFYKSNILQYYNQYKNSIHILELFQLKNKYLSTLKKEKIIINNVEKEYRYNFKKIPEVIDKNIIDKIIKSKTSKEITIYKKNIESRLLYLIQNIKDIIADVIAKSPLSDKYIGGIETSCCMTEADQYINFYQYFQLENDKIKSYIDEANNLYPLLNYFYNSGSYHRFYLYNKDKFAGCYNSIIVYDEKNASQKFLKSVFNTYVDKGFYKGTLRDFVGNNENAIDVKTGMTINEINSKNYSIEELNNLLYAIENKTAQFYKPQEIISLSNESINELKKNSLNLIDIQINILMNNLMILLNKNKDFVLKYTTLIKNIGIYNINNKLENKTQKEKIILRNNLYRKKLDYFKKFYINRFKKYLSIIKNNYDVIDKDIKLNFIDSSDLRKEMQQYIGENQEKFNFFLSNNIPSYFKDCYASYSNQEINSIIGVQDIYNKDYTEIIKLSNLNDNDVSNIILFILIKNLTDLFVYNNEKYELNLNDKKNGFIANFVLLLLNEIEDDFELFEICNQNNEMQNSILFDIITFRLKSLVSDQGFEITKFLRNLSKSRGIKKEEPSYFTEESELQQEESFEKKKELEEKLQFFNEEVINNYKKKHGHDPSKEYLEEAKQKIEEKIANQDYFNEINLDGELQSDEIMDKGGDYGELNPDDFETGNGFIYEKEEE
jgi:hypothetical protein